MLDGVSHEVVDAALAGVAYDPSVKAHDYGVAAFGHNFAGFAASHVTPGAIARGKAMLRTYAEPLAKIEQRFGVPAPVLVAIWGLETSFGADNGSFPTFRALATLGLGLPQTRAVSRRVDRRADDDPARRRATTS